MGAQHSFKLVVFGFWVGRATITELKSQDCDHGHNKPNVLLNPCMKDSARHKTVAPSAGLLPQQLKQSRLGKHELILLQQLLQLHYP